MNWVKIAALASMRMIVATIRGYSHLVIRRAAESGCQAYRSEAIGLATLRVSLLGTVCLLVACSKRPHSLQFDADDTSGPTKIEKINPKDAKALFGLSGPDQVRVAFHNSALGEREYLFRSSIITQNEAPSFSGLKSRIVHFEKREDALFMLESPNGQVTDPQIDSKLPLMAFPILESKNGWHYVDMNLGLSQVYTSTSWQASDFPAADDHFVSVPLINSYLSQAKIKANQALELEQIGQIFTVGAEDGALITLPVKTKIELKPYVQNLKFNMKLSPGFDFFGFFEVASYYGDDGYPRTPVTRFDLSEGIEFWVSHNTPSEFRDAIQDAVLYWNAAFQSEVLKVRFASAEISAPDFDRNVIQWINYPQAGFAYADAQADPRTGEILNAQIFMTSSFAISSVEQARRWLREDREPRAQFEPAALSKKFATATRHEHSWKPINGPRLAWRGFQTQPLGCHRSHRQAEFQRGFKMRIQQMLVEGQSDANFLKAAQDYIREVMAHEVGHVLGLRHNFAGSLFQEYPIERRDANAADYFDDTFAPESNRPSSTVMDYQSFEEALFSGSFIRHVRGALPYDAQAIQWLYFDRIPNREERLPFCTDSQMGLPGCTVFDVGAEPWSYSAYMMKRALRSMEYQFLSDFIAAKTPDPGRPDTEVADVWISPADVLFDVWAVQWQSFFELNTDEVNLAVSFPFWGVSPSYRAKLKEKQTAWLAEQLQKSGGMENVFATLQDDWLEQEIDDFKNLITQSRVQRGVGRLGQTYEFSQAEQEQMLHMVAAALQDQAQKVHEYQLEMWLIALSSIELTDSDIARTLATYFYDLARRFVLSLDDHQFISGRVGLLVAKDSSRGLAPSGVRLKPDDAAKADPTLSPQFFRELLTRDSNKASMGLFDFRPSEQVMLDVRLPKFKHSFKTRLLALALLAETSTEAPEWAVQERALLVSEFVAQLTSIMKTYGLEDVDPRTASPEIARWLIENQGIINYMQNYF